MTNHLKDRNIKVGDIVCLNYRNNDVRLIDYLKNKKEQVYKSIKIIPIDKTDKLINTPILLAGFETKIKELKEEGKIEFAYTSKLKINLGEALKAKEIKKIDAADTKSENQFFEHKNLIEKIKKINNTFCLRFITEIEKNSHLLDSLSSFNKSCYQKNSRIRANAEKEKPKFTSVNEMFSFTWKKILAQEKFWKDEIGFLYESHEDGGELTDLRIAFLLEAQKRELDKELRIGRSMSDFWLSRAKVHGKLNDCDEIIMITFRSKLLTPITLNLKGNYFLEIKFWEKGKFVDEIQTDEPWKNESFNLMIQNLISQEIC